MGALLLNLVELLKKFNFSKGGLWVIIGLFALGFYAYTIIYPQYVEKEFERKSQDELVNKIYSNQDSILKQMNCVLKKDEFDSLFLVSAKKSNECLANSIKKYVDNNDIFLIENFQYLRNENQKAIELMKKNIQNSPMIYDNAFALNPCIDSSECINFAFPYDMGCDITDLIERNDTSLFYKIQ